MKAVVHTEYGGPEVLRLTDAPIPTPGPNDVLVKVHAAALNPVDWHLMRGTPFPVRMMVGGLLRPKRPRVVGYDFSGTVAGSGAASSGLATGRSVFGYCESGSLAEYLIVPADKVALKPERLTFEQAAGIPLAGMTALQLMRKAPLRPDHRLLIVGAAGRIGTFAVQIARATGAHVTGVQSTAACELVRSLGADRVIDYTKEDFTTGDARYDVVFDNVSNRTLADVRRVVKPNGTIIPNGGGSPEKGISIVALLGTLAKRPFISQKLQFGVMNPNRADLQTLADMIQAGEVTPVIDRCYPLAAAADAMRHLETGHAHGKIVVTI